MTVNCPSKIGAQRDWVWRGWQIRYSYMRSLDPHQAKQTPILLLHGFGASIAHWRKNISVLAVDRTVYAVDLLGFGASRKPSIDYQINLWVEQVYDFWSTFIHQPIIIVGNSIGSLVALVAADRYPQMVKNLIMISLPDLSAEEEIIPKPVQPIVNGIKSTVTNRFLLKPLFYWVRRPKVAQKWAKIAYSNPDVVNDELMEIFLTPAQEQEAGNAFIKIIQGMTSPKFSPNIRHLLPNINIPMLLIWGKNDRMIPPQTASVLIQLNPQLELVNLDNVGHCAHDEAPEQVNQMIKVWLDKHHDRLNLTPQLPCHGKVGANF